MREVGSRGSCWWRDMVRIRGGVGFEGGMELVCGDCVLEGR